MGRYGGFFHAPVWRAGSLKDRRHVVRSLLDRLKRHFNSSVADLSPDGIWDMANIAVSCVGSSHQEMEQRVDQILSFVEKNEEDGEFELLDTRREVFVYGDI